MLRRRGRIVIVIGCGLTLALARAMIRGSSGAADAPLTKMTLGMPMPPGVGNMWFDLAKAQGWNKEFGIDLTIERATSSGAVTALVVGGGADLAGGVPDALMNAVAQGQDLVAFWKAQPPGSAVF